MEQAYWIDPEGKIAKVDSRHIHAITEKPAAFGLTKAFIDKVHKKHKEPIGSEGNAREEIMVKLMNRGWIRIRYVRQGDMWTVQLDEKSGVPYKDYLKKWAKIALSEKASEYSPINVINLEPVYVEQEHSLGEVAAGALSARRKRGTFADFLNPKKKGKGRAEKKSHKIKSA